MGCGATTRREREVVAPLAEVVLVGVPIPPEYVPQPPPPADSPQSPRSVRAAAEAERSPSPPHYPPALLAPPDNPPPLLDEGSSSAGHVGTPGTDYHTVRVPTGTTGSGCDGVRGVLRSSGGADSLFTLFSDRDCGGSAQAAQRLGPALLLRAMGGSDSVSAHPSQQSPGQSQVLASQQSSSNTQQTHTSVSSFPEEEGGCRQPSPKAKAGDKKKMLARYFREKYAAVQSIDGPADTLPPGRQTAPACRRQVFEWFRSPPTRQDTAWTWDELPRETWTPLELEALLHAEETYKNLRTIMSEPLPLKHCLVSRHDDVTAVYLFIRDSWPLTRKRHFATHFRKSFDGKTEQRRLQVFVVDQHEVRRRMGGCEAEGSSEEEDKLHATIEEALAERAPEHREKRKASHADSQSSGESMV
eukprot:TRINITY_DN525_c6_g1_i1.p1 TRINITY_DN525_c6_g1~~TRINITY_DN525_c6_g1_i1.p1  ORF type:complete len:415 (+),score=1.80 TRINITY_DN525_c6_g1_i1:135-1379(+)